MKAIYVFTLNSCGHCQGLKKDLAKASIEFSDIEITKNKDIWEEIIRQTGLDILPTVFIQEGNGGGGTVYTPGRDFQTNEEIIKIIKNNI
jgi:glutaredoxin